MRSDPDGFVNHRFGFWIGRAAAALLTIHCVSQAALAQAKENEPDAVILKWDQTWAVNADGSLTFHERKDVRINNDRSHGEFADPRITFNADTQKVNVISARTRLPNGNAIDVPAYSRNEVSPNGPAGWPAFANIHQVVLTFSGIEPGCVVELDYEVTTAKGAWSEFAGEVRMDHRYPIREHTFTIANPEPTETDFVNCMVRSTRGQEPVVVAGDTKVGGNGDPMNFRISGRTTQAFNDMRITQTDEPQSPPWQTYRPRFVFSAHADTAEWVKSLTQAIDAAAGESPEITKLAADWTRGAIEPGEKIRALQEKMAATFNFVDFPIGWRNSRSPRKAADVASGNYGVPEEAAGMLLALARASGLKARPVLLASNDIWRDAVRQDGFVSAFAVLVDAGAGAPEIWHPQSGRITRDKRWAGSKVMAIGSTGLETSELAAWTDPDESNCRISGDLTIAKDGAYSAKLRMRLSGLFVSQDGLRTTEQQKSRAAEILGRVVPNADVMHCNVRALTNTTFDADVEMKSRKPLVLTDGFHRLALAQDGPVLLDVPMPLTHSTRSQPVRLTGACDELVELTIHWPGGWSIESAPAVVPKTDGAWGAAEQAVSTGEDQLTLTRRIRLAQREIAPADFLTLRAALVPIRAEYGRTLLLLPKAP